MNMFEHTGTFTPDSLIASNEFPILKEGIGLKAGQGILKRGSLIIKATTGGAGYIAGTTETVETVSYDAVTPEEGDNPKTEGWYEKSGDNYIATNDTTAAEGKTYYEKTTTESTDEIAGKIFGILTDDADTGSDSTESNIPAICYQTGIFNPSAVIVTGEGATVNKYKDNMRELSLFLRSVQNYE